MLCCLLQFDFGDFVDFFIRRLCASVQGWLSTSGLGWSGDYGCHLKPRFVFGRGNHLDFDLVFTIWSFEILCLRFDLKLIQTAPWNFDLSKAIFHFFQCNSCSSLHFANSQLRQQWHHRDQDCSWNSCKSDFLEAFEIAGVNISGFVVQTLVEVSAAPIAVVSVSVETIDFFYDPCSNNLPADN